MPIASYSPGSVKSLDLPPQRPHFRYRQAAVKYTTAVFSHFQFAQALDHQLLLTGWMCQLSIMFMALGWTFYSFSLSDSSKLDAVFQIWSIKYNCVIPFFHLPVHSIQDAAGCLCWLGRLLAHVELAADQHCQLLFCWTIFHLLFPKAVSLHQVAMTHVT